MIIDFHTHVFPAKIAGKTISALSSAAGIPPYSDGTVDGLLSEMKEGGVDVAVNLPVLTRPEQFDSILRFAEEINAGFSGRGVLSFAGIHPDDENIKERMKYVKDKGFLGVKIHPDYQGHFIDDDGYIEILREAKANDLIVVTHAGLDSAFVGQPIKCTPERVVRALDKIGGYEKLVLAHLGGCELFTEVYTHLAGLPVYLDTAYILHDTSREDFKKMLEKHGSDRILFATDSPWQKISAEVEMIKSFSLGEEAEKKIFSENARKLLSM